MTTKIPLEEIEWNLSSAADPVGRIFLWNGGIYRAIRASATPFVEELFKKGVLDRLAASGLMIESEIVPLSVAGFGLVLRHRRIRFPSYPFEWCGEMFRDAALLIWELDEELRAAGLELKDAHPWNVMFDDWRPRFIDIGSIRPASPTNRWGRYQEFSLYAATPLYAMAAGKGDEVRELLRFELSHSAFPQKVLRLLPWQRRLYAAWDARFAANRFKRVGRNLQSLRFRHRTTEWSTYGEPDDYFLPFEPSPGWLEKQKNVYELLTRLRPTSVADIGCNNGWFAELAARQHIHVLAADLDEPSISELHTRARSRSLAIHAVLLDFVRATASNITWPAAADRFRSDMVLALALVHHLVFKNFLNFDVIARELSCYTERWLLVEFVPAHDPHLISWPLDRAEWYNLDSFCRALGRFFNKIEVLESAPAPRKLVLCERA